MRPVAVGVRVPACERVEEVVRCIAYAEEAGFDSVWIPDTPLLAREVHVVLAAAAARTSDIRLAVGVTNFETRDVSVLVSAWQALSELAGDRLVCGVGVGASAVYLTGRRRTGHARFRERIEAFRALQRGERYPLGERPVALRQAARPVPLHVAAGGPRNLRLAGAAGDGVILATGTSPSLIAEAARLAGEGAGAAGRTLDGFEVVVTGYAGLEEDDRRVARTMKPVCLHFALTGQHHLLDRAGIDLRGVVAAEVPPVYPDFLHAEDWEEAMRVADGFVDDAAALRYAREFGLFGKPASVAERMRQAGNAGATTVCLRHHDTYALPFELIAEAGEHVLPLLR